MMLKTLRKKLGHFLRVMADKISGESEEIYRSAYSRKKYFGRRLTDEEISAAWRRAAEKVGPFKFPEGVEILK